MPLDGNIRRLSLEIQNEWDRTNLNQPNPLKLDDQVVQESLKLAPPLEFEGGTHLGRHLVPSTHQDFGEDDQSRNKGCDPNHVDGLVNKYTLNGYDIETQPPIGIVSENNRFSIRMLGGFNRGKACLVFGQAFYIVDVYEFTNPLDKRVATSQINHHKDLSLSQTINDYVKEIVNAAESNEIESTETAIESLANRVAGGDKTNNQIKAIVSGAIKLIGSVYANFTVYSSKKGTSAGKYTLASWLVSYNIAKQGIEHRTDKELISQGYISYCAAEGDNKSTWARAIYHGQRLGIPVWIFGYSSIRVDDLPDFRKLYMEEFEDYKSIMIDWASSITKFTLEDGIDEDAFCVKFAGFLPQHVKPNASKGGSPTEVGLVNQKGESIVFDYLGNCLTLS